MTIKNTFADKAISYFLNLSEPLDLKDGISFLNPYLDKQVINIVTKFYKKFFDDNQERIFLLGINPGRFGGGITGISFTDPVALEDSCGIKNDFDKKTELSSKFVYSFISSYGSAKEFYSKFFISALFPLALIKAGKNYNYYDDKNTYKKLKPYIVNSMKCQTAFGASNKLALCLGRKNFKYLEEINNEYNFFNKIVVLDHPRYIMQYKLKQLDKYINEYLNALRKK